MNANKILGNIIINNNVHNVLIKKWYFDEIINNYMNCLSKIYNKRE